MKHYVIGGNGFLGRHLVTFLGRDGQVRSAPPHDDKDQMTWVNALLEDMSRFEPQVVLVPGASQAMGDDPKSIHTLINSNCVLPCLVAERLATSFPATKLIVFGTSWQFADADRYRPFNLYAASKQAGQDLLEHYSLCGLKIAHLIMFDTYGPNDKRRKLLKILQDACASGAEIATTPGEQEIDLVHIDDVCTGVAAAIDELEKWDPALGILIRGLGSGRPIPVKELISRVETYEGRPMAAKIGARDYRAREVMKVYRKYSRPAGWVINHTEFHE